MSTPARIDELRKKFDENPRRYFAPLANEYRKAGDLAQAIALCREFLPGQPGHMSGHIVFGQALYELGLLQESRAVFGSALTLDPENLIALRHLGDIAKASGDAADARRWYERVLDADPRNDDIAAQLANLVTGDTPAVSLRSVPEYGIGPSRSGAHPSFVPPSMPTPAYGVGVGMQGLPTPDASMRAVDFDQVNERIARRTPLHVSALDESAPPPPAGVEQHDAIASAPAEQHEAVASAPLEQRAFEPLDLDAMEAMGDAVATDLDADREPAVVDDETQHVSVPAAVIEVPVATPQADASEEESGVTAQQAAHADGADAHEDTAEDTASPFDEAMMATNEAPERAADASTRLWFESPANATENNSFADVGNAFATFESGATAPLPDDDWGDAFAAREEPDSVSASAAGDADDFEDGILAPEWPEASAILASIATPRSRTPISVEVTPEAAEAFGREPHEMATHNDDDFADEIAVEPAHSESVLSATLEEWRDDSSVGLDGDVAPEARHDVVDAVAQASSDVDSQFNEPEPLVVDAGQGESTFADMMDHHDVDVDDAHAEQEQGAQESQSPLFVTETMGELLVAQGFVRRAVEVYDALVRRRPYDPVLTSRLAELRERLVLESVAPDSIDSPSAAPERFAASTVVADQGSEQTPIATENLSGGEPTPEVAMSPSREAPANHFAHVVTEPPELTSRELFARLAARRVPRRTPARAMQSLQERASSGLESLFGSAGSSNDDMAARALADAFAPISEAEMATGTTLDVEFGRPAAQAQPTPAWSAPSIDARDDTLRDREGDIGVESARPAPSHPTPSMNAGFSFDKFFPDPASPASKSGPAALSSDTTASGQAKGAAPATDDLAQFSAWLKGLGNA